MLVIMLLLLMILWIGSPVSAGSPHQPPQQTVDTGDLQGPTPDQAAGQRTGSGPPAPAAVEMEHAATCVCLSVLVRGGG